jgi:uncharacterized membrane protein
MEKEKFNQIRAILLVAIGIMVIYGALRNSYTLAMVAVLLGIVALFVMRQRITDILFDERTRVIREKAASKTLGLVIALMGIAGLVLIEISFNGYPEIRDIGYTFAYLSMIIMAVYGFFTWYYQTKLGG